MFLTGAIVAQLIDGVFYWWAAGDFFFSLRATLSASQNVPGLAEEASAQVGWAAMAWERLTIFLRPRESGWGMIGIAFWPVVILAALLNRTARVVAAWALGVFALVAFIPVSFKAGAQAYPIFHGRHILPACIPFALCLGWCLCRASEVVRPSWRSGARPAFAMALIALAFVNPRELNGFRDRATSRVGVAAAQAATSIPDDGRPIFMTPSAYWRYRVVFPPAQRQRLRVAAAADAPTWWKDTCADIAARQQPLPSPREAYLLATPRQLRGEPEQWDYGVTLPAGALAAWRTVPPLATLVRHADRHIGPPAAGSEPLETLLVLAGSGDSPAIAQARR